MSTLAINEHAREDLLKCNSCVRNWMVISVLLKELFCSRHFSREVFSESTGRKWQKRWGGGGMGGGEWKGEFGFISCFNEVD